MKVSKKSRAADAAHTRHMKKLTPKQRLKTLSKADQYTIYTRTLAYHLDCEKKRQPRYRSYIYGYMFTLSSLKSSYIELDSVNGLLTSDSKRKIKRAVANAIKASLGKDAVFLFSIEQRDKDGEITDPHVHGAFVAKIIGLFHPDLKRRLYRIAGDDGPNTLELKHYNNLLKRPNELAESEATARRWALYQAKNDDTWFYRSKPLMQLVAAHFERLKEHYHKP